MKKLLLVGTGGFIGSVLRYLVSGWIYGLSQSGVALPYGTMFVNVTGCFLIGLVGGLGEMRQLFSPETRLFVLVGLLGGFTTYSTFSYETLSLARDGQWLAIFLNIFLHLLLGLGAVWLGYVAARLL